MELTNFNSEVKYSSRYLVEQINIFRKEEGNATELLHKNFLAKIENEFEEEISRLNILPSSYLAGNGKQEKCYELNFEQSLQILMSESKTVRKRCVEVMKTQQKAIAPQTYKQALLALIAVEEEKEQLALQVDNLSTALDSLVEWVSIIKVAQHNSISEKCFDWHILKAKSKQLGYEVKKAQSNRYDYQNLYHINAFKSCYPQYNYNLLK